MAKKKIKAPLLFRVIRALFPYLEKYIPFLAKWLVVRFFFTPFRFKPRAGEEDLINTANPFELIINKNRVHGRSWGKGPLAVLVHGWSGRGMQMRWMIKPLLAKGYQVITFDAPGHGRSQGKESSIIEFKDTLFGIENKFGPISLLLGHSLGAAACIFSIKEGLVVQQFVSLSAPTISSEIMKEFLKKINASWNMSQALDDYVIQLTGNNFDYYSGQLNVKSMKSVPILAFHDKDDKELKMDHADTLVKEHGNTTLIKTEGLGHNRILKNKAVIDKIVEFSKINELVKSKTI